ncbi:hypothetical protein ISS30_08435 [bacterium]|nr:hypothetical protein [FCB group bacterium]MBL7191710.1 hypothetical protein [bacterium]
MIRRTIKTLILLAAVIGCLSCTTGKYLLDQPVSDPIMYTDDTQDSDLSRVEDGGYSGSTGECPT